METLTMKNDFKKILVFQTAFLGDVILTLPMIQILRKNYPFAQIDFATTPKAKEIVNTHPEINNLIIFDKKNTESGFLGVIKIAKKIKRENYDIVFSPHRSFRTALILFLSRIPNRITFDKSSFKFLYTKIVSYNKNLHEVDRNLFLLSAINLSIKEKEIPKIKITAEVEKKIQNLLNENNIGKNIISIAPFSIWKTKIWPHEYYEKLILLINENYQNYNFIIIGGKVDEFESKKIIKNFGIKNIFTFADKLNLIESAEIIKKSKLLITNDSAPLHIGSSVQTKIIALFGPTIPEFGFGPYGDGHTIIENKNLHCRPCSIHGGDKCPIKTFECMKSLTPEIVFEKIKILLKE